MVHRFVSNNLVNSTYVFFYSYSLYIQIDFHGLVPKLALRLYILNRIYKLIAIKFLMKIVFMKVIQNVKIN